jgi:hypothetical protein
MDVAKVAESPFAREDGSLRIRLSNRKSEGFQFVADCLCVAMGGVFATCACPMASSCWTPTTIGMPGAPTGFIAFSPAKRANLGGTTIPAAQELRHGRHHMRLFCASDSLTANELLRFLAAPGLQRLARAGRRSHG